MPSASMRQLLEAGVHFGHQTRRWNPKMRPFIFAERNGIHIIDLAQTVKRLDVALQYVTETTARGDGVLFVGTKKQAQEPIAEEATRAGQPYVNQRWLGGMLTNFVTIKKRLAPARAARGQAGQRRLRADVEEGSLAPDRRDDAAPADRRRHAQDEAPARRGLHRRPASRAHRDRRSPQARDPGHRHRRYERRPGRARLHHPGQRRRHPRHPPALQPGRRGGHRGRPAAGRPRPRPSSSSRKRSRSRPSRSRTRPPARSWSRSLRAGGSLSYAPDPEEDETALLPVHGRPIEAHPHRPAEGEAAAEA